MKYHIKTWGCQMNVLDSHVLEGAFRAAGLSPAPAPDLADVIVLNTCSVRAHAENKVFSNLGTLAELKACRPGTTIVVAGCMAQRLGADLRNRFPQVDLVVGTARTADIVALVDEVRSSGPAVHTESDVLAAVSRDVTFRASLFQAYVCAMRGCDNFCAYCIVPYVRGRQSSRPASGIIDEVKALAADGVKEITLLGQNVTAYGLDRGEKGALSRLLASLQEVDGLEWIKFVTSHPKDTGDDVFCAMRDFPKVCRYLHMPAQAGSDRVLAAMRRGYTRSEYLDRIARLRETVPDVSVAGDFIVGFPGETAADFEETVSLLREVGYKNSFIFKYSPRPLTSASKLPDDLPRVEKARRNNALLDVQKEVSLAHNSRLVGRTVKVLVSGPSRKEASRLQGRTEGEEIVVFDGPAHLAGTFVDVTLTAASPLTLFGAPLA